MEAEISVLEKGLDFALIQSKLKMDWRMDYELRIDFDNFCNYIRTKWYFRNKPLYEACFSAKFSWRPLIEHISYEVYSSQTENELFQISKEKLWYSNLIVFEWGALLSLARYERR